MQPAPTNSAAQAIIEQSCMQPAPTNSAAQANSITLDLV